MQRARNIQDRKQHMNMRHCYDCHLQELSEAEVTNPSFESGADLHQGPEQMCVPICTDTRVHTRYTAVSPDLHPVMLASTGKEQMDWLGLDRMDTQGNQICLFDVENPKQNEPL